MALKPQKQVRTVDEFKTQLRRHSLKATRPRIAVHTVMMELVHASPDQVVEKFRESGVRLQHPFTTCGQQNLLPPLLGLRQDVF